MIGVGRATRSGTGAHHEEGLTEKWVFVGLYEAIAIVRWDWLMDDMRVGGSWASVMPVILAFNIGLFSLLGGASKKLFWSGRLRRTGLQHANLGRGPLESTSLSALRHLHPVDAGGPSGRGSLGLAIALATPGQKASRSTPRRSTR